MKIRLVWTVVVSLLVFDTVTSAASEGDDFTFAKDDIDDSDEYQGDGTSWITCGELMDHIWTLSKHGGSSRHPMKIKGYGKGVCRQVLRLYREHEPEKLDAIVNIGTHIQRGRELKHDSKIENVALGRRRRLDTDCSYANEMGVVGSSATSAIPIGECPNLADDNSTQSSICIPNYSNNSFYNAQSLWPGDEDDALQDFLERDMTSLYPSGRAYNTWMAGSSDLAPDVASGNLWTGCSQDRVGKSYDDLAGTVLGMVLSTAAVEVADMICKQIAQDDIDVPVPVGFWIFVLETPNPVMVKCQVVNAVLKLIQLAFSTLNEKINNQNGWVDNAEIQAGHENSQVLLQTQCGTFHEAVCRISTRQPVGDDSEDPANVGTGAYGVGCDGVDSDCDGDPDNCAEDKYPPQVVLQNTVTACGSGRWFKYEDDAIQCVRDTVVASDDCNGVTEPVVIRNPDTFCNETIFEISVYQKYCAEFGGNTTVEQKIFVDDELPPVVTCSVGPDNQTAAVVAETGPGVLTKIPLTYDAQDGCGIASTTVTVYSNELEDFNAQNMAVLYDNYGEEVNEPKLLYVASSICSNDSNGQCIKDSELREARLYTIVVGATDFAGRKGSAECAVLVVPNDSTSAEITEIANKAEQASTQRFPVATASDAVFSNPY